MCMACEEMQLYYAYLDMVEEQERRKAQPWQCEVTVVAPADEALPAEEPSAAPKAASAPAKSGFVCDTPE